jgi:hypothetical protein
MTLLPGPPPTKSPPSDLQISLVNSLGSNHAALSLTWAPPTALPVIASSLARCSRALPSTMTYVPFGKSAAHPLTLSVVAAPPCPSCPRRSCRPYLLCFSYISVFLATGLPPIPQMLGPTHRPAQAAAHKARAARHCGVTRAIVLSGRVSHGTAHFMRTMPLSLRRCVACRRLHYIVSFFTISSLAHLACSTICVPRFCEYKPSRLASSFSFLCASLDRPTTSEPAVPLLVL